MLSFDLEEHTRHDARLARSLGLCSLKDEGRRLNANSSSFAVRALLGEVKLRSQAPE